MSTVKRHVYLGEGIDEEVVRRQSRERQVEGEGTLLHHHASTVSCTDNRHQIYSGLGAYPVEDIEIDDEAMKAVYGIEVPAKSGQAMSSRWNRIGDPGKESLEEHLKEA